MSSKNPTSIKSYQLPGNSKSRRKIKPSIELTPTPKSTSIERPTLIALVVGCAVLLYLTELLITSNASYDSLQKKLLPRFPKFEYYSPSSSNPHNNQQQDPGKILTKLNLREETTKSGDDAQLSWPTSAPTIPSISDIEAYFAATNIYPDETYIALMPSKKTGIRQDRRVVFENFAFEPYTRPDGVPSNIKGRPRALVAAELELQNHPIYKSQYLSKPGVLLEDTIEYIQKSPQCIDKPVFLTMATVGDDLYWQLIENFVYTMVKYHVSDCSLVICVSDKRCMEMCKASYFPCYEYRSEVMDIKEGEVVVAPSVMEQIAEVKLLHIPKAMSKNVSVFMLDLDVGFLADPMFMVKAFFSTPRVDIFVQEDMIFVMNRSKAGWKTWSTEPLPNIGLFLTRGNSKTMKVFDIAWERYNRYTDSNMKKEPGKDQNHVLEGMRNSRVKIGLRYAYFDNYTAILLDKYIRLTDPLAELGGEASAVPMQHRRSIAVHTTCYEKSTKVMGLKATNAFWNPKYYDPLRRTITKSLLYLSDSQLLDEVRSLLWLGLRTDRAVIVPNILGPDDMTVQPYHHPDSHDGIGLKLWPGFRVVKFKRVDGHNLLKVDVLEPGFYWRVSRDYDLAPHPSVVLYDPNSHSLEDIRLLLEQDEVKVAPRVVLYPSVASASLTYQLHKSSRNYILMKKEDIKDIIIRAIKWADDSVGWYENGYDDELIRYGHLPSVKAIRDSHESIEATLQGMRTCNKIFVPMKGNRSCFEICD